jgi:hypothetical protein
LGLVSGLRMPVLLKKNQSGQIQMIDQLRKEKDHKPFRPIIIELDSGTQFLIEISDDLVISPTGRVIIFEPSGLVNVIDAESVRRVAVT